MDTRLRELYRAYGGNDWRYLMGCLRAGGIPSGSSIALDQLPETAKYADLGQARPAYMVEHELDYTMHLGLVGSSPLGNMVTQYILSSDEWTLYSYTRQHLTNMFLMEAKGQCYCEGCLTDLVEDEIYVEEILFDIVDNLLDDDITAVVDHHNATLHRMVWAQQIRRVLAVVKMPLRAPIMNEPDQTLYVDLVVNDLTRAPAPGSAYPRVNIMGLSTLPTHDASLTNLVALM